MLGGHRLEIVGWLQSLPESYVGCVSLMCFLVVVASRVSKVPIPSLGLAPGEAPFKEEEEVAHTLSDLESLADSMVSWTHVRYPRFLIG